MFFMDDAKDVNTANDFTGANPYDTVVQPGPSGAPVSGEVVGAKVATGSVVYAGFWQRFVADIIDTVLIGIPMIMIQFIFANDGVAIGLLLSLALGYSYYIYFISQKGQTPGKRVASIRVQDVDTGSNIDVVSAILRELVGKAVSSGVLFLGYFWMLWDDKKQTWHDKIAKSVVVKVK